MVADVPVYAQYHSTTKEFEEGSLQHVRYDVKGVKMEDEIVVVRLEVDVVRFVYKHV